MSPPHVDAGIITEVTQRQIRMCFVGDSFVAGVGDPAHLGWVGRLTARAETRGVTVTGYNLGIRRNTSSDVRARWQHEVRLRFPDGLDNRLVLSFGVNDCTARSSGTRTESGISSANLDAILTEARRAGWPVLVVGPAPIADTDQNDRIRALNDRFTAVCTQHAVTYVDTFAELIEEPSWAAEVNAGDGSHPSTAGYERLTEIIYGLWWAWLTDEALSRVGRAARRG
ncbi:MAG: hypothetical protein DLM58_08040 [Pseudonocardiales bacterium]|nr:MAG: hypothetical protein DLM58_08040 [Pseudonocardiales bacterium]